MDESPINNITTGRKSPINILQLAGSYRMTVLLKNIIIINYHTLA